jgi:protein-tyrosine phosphatase
VVCLCERHELADRYPDYVAWLRAHADDDGTGAIWFPIHDLHAPGMEQADSFLDRVVALLVGGHTVLMHCGAGIGRAGTMAAAVLMRMGLDRSSACAAVAAARPLAGPEAGGQSDFLAELASSDRP